MLIFHYTKKNKNRIFYRMRILYKNKTVEKQFSSKYKKTWRYPLEVMRKLEKAENYIISSSSLFDIVNYPPFHFHGLHGERKGEWSIYLGNTGYRVTMIPCDNDGNEIVSGDVMSKCRVIRIVCITEVSNHYE